MRKNIKKALIITLSFIIFLTATSTGVFAWFNQKKGNEIQLNMRSSELFNPTLLISSNDQKINYNNQTKYNRNSLEVILKPSDFTYDSNTYTIDFKSSVYIYAYQNIYVKLKMSITILSNTQTVVAQTSNSSTTYDLAVNKPNIVSQTKDLEGYHLYPHEIRKDEPVEVSFTDKLKINQSLEDTDLVKVIITAKAIQANRKDSVWNTHQEITQTEDFTAGDKEVDVKLQGITNSQYTRGLVIDFIKTTSYEKHTVLWRINESTSLQKVNLSGNYKVIIYATNFIKISKITQTETKIEITLTYNTTPLEWGYEDIIYSPNIISEWMDGQEYKKDDIVYYQGKYYKVLSDHTSGTVSGNTPTNQGRYAEINNQYKPQTFFFKDSVVYYSGTFWLALKDTWDNPTGGSGAWKNLGYNWNNSQTYLEGNVVYLMKNNIKTWYIATAAVGPYVDPSAAHASDWKEITFEYNSTKVSAYKTGDIFYRTENNIKVWYYVKNNDHPYASLESGDANNKYGKFQNPTTFNPNTVYSNNDLVTYEGKTYYRILSDAISKPIPGEETGWNELTEEWQTKSLYKKYQVVTYNYRTYVWLGDDYQNISTGVPSDNNQFYEITERWVSGNQYQTGDTVI
ncbi:MAG: hypothetical protein GX312_04350, partial [Candidatus Phytoplasma sp.]|nr:hypothetical protein [Phytoplasma sp.]